jgi:hypothetical protein
MPLSTMIETGAPRSAAMLTALALPWCRLANRRPQSRTLARESVDHRQHPGTAPVSQAVAHRVYCPPMANLRCREISCE